MSKTGGTCFRTAILCLGLWLGTVAAFAGGTGSTPVKLEFAKGITFKGEHVVTAVRAMDVGIVGYPGFGVFAGAFVDGVPQGLCTLTVDKGPVLIIVFDKGVPVSMYRAQSVEPFRAQSVQPYQADTIGAFNADTIPVYQGDTIKPVHAQPVAPIITDTIEPHRTGAIDPFQTERVREHTAEVVSRYDAKPVDAGKLADTVTLFSTRLSEARDLLADKPVPVQTAAVGYPTPLQQEWMGYMAALPFLIYGGR